MRNFRIYLLVLLLAIASQSLFAVDGWWEKVETKNKPTGRGDGAMCNIAEDKVLMIGGGFYGTPPKGEETRLWLFDYKTKDWQVLNVETPEFFKKETIPWNSLVRLSENKALLYLARGAASDSANWIFHLDEMRWELVDSAGGPAIDDFPHMSLCNLDEGVVMLYMEDSRTFIFDYNIKKKNLNGRYWYDLNPIALKKVFQRYYVSMARLKKNQALVVGGTQNFTDIDHLPYDTINVWLFNFNDTTWRPIDLPKITYRSPHFIVPAVRLYDEVVMSFYGDKDMESYLFIPKSKEIFKKMYIQDSIPYRFSSNIAELKDGRALVFGGGGFNKNGSVFIFDETWIFHADPILGIENESKSENKLSHYFTIGKFDFKIPIEESVETINIYNLMGSKLTYPIIKQNGSFCTIDNLQANQIYLIEIKSNKQLYQFTIMKGE